MNKDAIVQALARGAGISKADAEGALKAVVTAITAAVAAGEKVNVPGLGTFEPRARAARKGRHPQSGATIQIAATTLPGFKPAAAFKTAVADK